MIFRAPTTAQIGLVVSSVIAVSSTFPVALAQMPAACMLADDPIGLRPACSICGEGSYVGDPFALFPIGRFGTLSCGGQEALGVNGFLRPRRCNRLQSATDGSDCDCTPCPTPAPITPAPITPAPITPAPITPAPITPAPITPAPITPAPITPAPITPAPITPAPITPAPITPAPITPAPITPATPAPITPAPITPAPITPAPVVPPDACMLSDNPLGPADACSICGDGFYVGNNFGFFPGGLFGISLSCAVKEDLGVTGFLGPRTCSRYQDATDGSDCDCTPCP